MSKSLQRMLAYSEAKEQEQFTSLSDAGSARSYTKTPLPGPVINPRFEAPEVPCQRAIWAPGGTDNNLEDDLEDDAYEILVNVYFEEYVLVEGTMEVHHDREARKYEGLLGLNPIAKGRSKEVFMVRLYYLFKSLYSLIIIWCRCCASTMVLQSAAMSSKSSLTQCSCSASILPLGLPMMVVVWAAATSTVLPSNLKPPCLMFLFWLVNFFLFYQGKFNFNWQFWYRVRRCRDYDLELRYTRLATWSSGSAIIEWQAIRHDFPYEEICSWDPPCIFSFHVWVHQSIFSNGEFPRYVFPIFNFHNLETLHYISYQATSTRQATTCLSLTVRCIQSHSSTSRNFSPILKKMVPSPSPRMMTEYILLLRTWWFYSWQTYTLINIDLFSSPEPPRFYDKPVYVGDLDSEGIAGFCKEHRCNRICWGLGLQAMPFTQNSQDGGTVE